MLKQTRAALRDIYREDYHYHKAGVIMSRITPFHFVQPDLFGEVSLHEHYRQAKLIAVVDAINRIFGRGTLMFAMQGFAHKWRMQQERLSPRFMSRWEELLTN